MNRNIAVVSVIVSLIILLPVKLLAEPKLNIVTTLFPTYDFVRQVGKNKVRVTLLLPPGVEPHSFEPTPRDIVRINKADLFVYTGRGMEPWAADILKGVTAKKLLAVDTSRGISLLDATSHEHHHDQHSHKESGHHSKHEKEHDHDSHHSKHDEKHDHDSHQQHDESSHHSEHEEGHDHGAKDPHFWLDFENAQKMVTTITEALVQKDPLNKDVYLQNAQDYRAKLAALDGGFKHTLSHCRHRMIISGGHLAFGYLAERYGLAYVSVYKTFAPNAEPSPKAIAKLIGTLRQSGSKTIFYEELIDPKVARIVARETGATLRLLHGAHNLAKKELRQGMTFLSIMNDNLKQLQNGLECR